VILIGGFALISLTSGAGSDVVAYPDVITKFKAVSGELLTLDSADSSWDILKLDQGDTYGTFSLYVVKSDKGASVKETVNLLSQDFSEPDSNGIQWKHTTDSAIPDYWVAQKIYHDNIVVSFFGDGGGPDTTPDPAFTRLDGVLRTL
jgi:hypothetical protein